MLNLKKVTDLVIGEEAQVIASLSCYNLHVTKMDNYVGGYFKINNIGLHPFTDDNIELLMNNDFILWYPMCFLKFKDEPNSLNINEIKPGLKCIVGKSQISIDYNKYMMRGIPDSYIYLKYVNIIDTNPICIIVRSNITEYYVKVKYENNIFTLPLCSLFKCEPDYSPRQLIKEI
jgi:hypothetical protein